MHITGLFNRFKMGSMAHFMGKINFNKKSLPSEGVGGCANMLITEEGKCEQIYNLSVPHLSYLVPRS